MSSIIIVLIIVILIVGSGSGYYGHTSGWQGLGGHVGISGLTVVVVLLLILLFVW